MSLLTVNLLFLKRQLAAEADFSWNLFFFLIFLVKFMVLLNNKKQTGNDRRDPCNGIKRLLMYEIPISVVPNHYFRTHRKQQVISTLSNLI